MEPSPPPDEGREIEIAEPGASPPPPEEGAEPYRNLMVPLVVVPALIVMVGVVIVALFGLLSGEMKSPRENLDRLLSGGANERQQAAFELVRQMLDYQTARAEGREPEWGIDASFLSDLERAREALPEPETEQDLWVPFVLSSLMAQLGDAEGVTQLVDFTRLEASLDPEFSFGQNAIFVLGSVGRELAPAQRQLVAARMIELTRSDDEGLILLAAAALQNLDHEDTRPTLRGLLGSRRLDLRIQAALSLVELGDDAGTGVLLEAALPGPYEAEHAEFPQRWAPQTVSETRRRVLVALDRLGVLAGTELLTELAAGDPDPNVRSVALELAD